LHSPAATASDGAKGKEAEKKKDQEQHKEAAPLLPPPAVGKDLHPPGIKELPPGLETDKDKDKPAPALENRARRLPRRR